MVMNVKKFRYLIIILLAVILVCGCSTAPKRPDQIKPGIYDYAKEYITWFTKKAMKKNQVMGVSIAIVDNQRIVWAQGFGYADVKNNVPATPQTVYRIGSISKLFTVMATMQLAEQKKIDIDQPLHNYLPHFSVKTRFPDSGPITLRTMMTHHSGLPSGVVKGMWASESPTTLLYRLKDEYVAYPTNYVLAYSNVAMALLGLMIEQVSDTEFCAHLKQTVLGPIGMQQSSFQLTPEIKSLLSKGYRNGKENKQLPLRDVAAGSMYSNVLDLSRFMQIIFANGADSDRQIIQTDTIDEMLRPQNEAVTLDFDKRIGLGWFLNYDNETNTKIAFHSGGTPLFHTVLLILPEKKIGVVVLTNSAEGSRIYGKIAKEALKLALEAKTGKASEKREHQITAPDKMVSEEMLQSFVGRYATLNMLGSVARDNSTLKANMGGYKFRLLPSSNGKFGVERKLLGIFPLKKIGNLELAKIRAMHMNFNGRELLIVYYNNRHWFSSEKMDPLPIPVTWKNASGEYQVVNPDPDGSPQDIALSNEEGVLVFSYNMPMWNARKSKLYLTPISETEAITLGIGRSSGETMRIINMEDEEGLYFWGFKMRKKPS
jgi:CubicO group peptidase (beta-lactamase class C family)